MALSKDFIVKNGLVVQNTATIQSTQNSTSSNSGAFTVAGGAGVGADMWVAGNIYSGGVRVAVATATISSIIAGTDTAVSTNTGVVIVWNTSTLQSVTSRGATTTYAINITNSVISTGTNTGALTVQGGVGIGGALFVGQGAYISGDLYVDGSQTILNVNYLATGDKTLTFSTGSTTAALAINSGIQVGSTSTPYISWLFDGVNNWKSSGGIISNNTVTVLSTALSNSTNTGALQVAGGVGIGGNTYVGGNLVVTGTITGNIAVVVTTATNIAGGTAGQLHYQSAPGVTSFAGPGVAGQILLSSGTNAPFYTSTASIMVNASSYAGTSTNIAGGSGGYIPYQTNPGLTNFITAGAAGNILISAGGGQPTFTSTTTFIVGYSIYANTATYASTSTNIAGGTPGALYYQVSTGTTGFIGIGPSGYLLQSNGATATWVSTSTLGIGGGSGSAINVVNNTTTAVAQYITFSSISTGTLTTLGVSNSNITFTPSIGQLALGSITSSTSTTTGALVVAGGVGVGGGMYVGGNLTLTGTAPRISGDMANGTWANRMSFQSNITSGATVVQALPNATGGTTAYIRTFNAGDADNASYGTFGTTPTEVKVESAQKGTGALLPLNLYAGNALQLSISTTSVVTITSIAASNSTNTGALVVTGGVGIGGNLVVGGIISGTVTSAITATNIVGGATGSLLYQSTAGITTTLPLGGNGYILTAGVNVPQWTPVGALYAGQATTATNLQNGISGQIPYQQSPGATQFFGPGSTGSFVMSNGGGSPSFVATSTMYVGFAVTATNIAGGTAGQLHYQSAPGVTAFAGPGVAGQILLSTGASAPLYVNSSSVYVGQAILSNNLIGGAAGSLPYQSAANTTTFLALGTTGYVLTAGGSAPQWTAIGSLSAGVATTATNLLGGVAGQIPIQSAPGITTFINTGAVGTILQQQVGNTATFASTGTIQVGAAQFAVTSTYATTSTNIAGGSAGAIVYQTAGGQTQFIANSATYAGYVLQSNGSTATWQPVAALTVSSATNAVNVAITDDNATATPEYLTFVNASSGYTNIRTNAAKLSYVPSTGILAAPNMFITGTGASTSTTSSNALYVAGGAYVDSLFVRNATTFAGNVTFNGTATYVYSTNTFYTDNIIEIHVPPGGVNANWTVDDGKDIGLRFHYFTNSTDTNAALVLANDSKYLEWYNTGAESTGSTFTSATYGTFKTGAIILMNTATAVSTQTGALQLQGGVGIARDLFVGGNITVNGSINATINGVVSSATQVAITNDLASITPQFMVFTAGSAGYNALKTAANTGMTYIPSSGYYGIGVNTPTATLHVNGSHIITGVTTVTNTTQSISTNSGALQVAGGAGVGGNLFATALFDNGNRVVTSVTPTAGTAIGISSLISTGTNASFIINNLGVTSAIGTTYLGVSASTGSVTFTNLGVQTLTAGTDTAVSASTGTITIWDTSTLQSITGRGNTTNNQVIITNATAATTTTNGALQVTGGVGIQGNLYVGGIISGNFVGSVTTSSNIAVVNNTSSAVAQYITFASTSTGFVQLNTDATSGLTFVPSTWSLGVGVVATASTVKVDVNGEIRTGGIGLGYYNTAGSSGYWWNTVAGTRADGFWNDTTNSRLSFRKGNTDNVMIIDSNNNVGIGTIAVDNAGNYRTLSIGGTTGGQITWQNGTTYKGFSYNDATNMIHGAQASLLFMSGGATEAGRFDASRNFMVGTSSAIGKVTVQGGSLTVASSTGYALSVGNANSNDLTIGSDASYNYIQTWNTKPLQINNQGNNIYLAGNVSANVGIGQLTAGVKLDVGGSIRATQSVTIGSGGNYQAGSIYADANWGMLFRSATSAPTQATFAWHNFADTEYMRLDAVGNLGLGTTTPTATFQNTGGEKIAGVFTSSNITNTLNTTSGAINTLGGVGIAQDLRVGGTIYGNNIIGNISGVASTSTNATNVNITNDTASATAQYVTFVAASSGYTPVKTAAATGLVYIPSTNSFGIGTATPAYNLQVNGSFAAVTKSFVIDHPTKSGMKLRHGSLEGPENGVYVRGRLTDSNVIELPDYWTGLVDENSITVDLTPIGKHQKLFVQKIENNQVYVGNDGMFSNSINCFYTVWAERKDVDKLVVEIE